jgi:hypothetical protein
MAAVARAINCTDRHPYALAARCMPRCARAINCTDRYLLRWPPAVCPVACNQLHRWPPTHLTARGMHRVTVQSIARQGHDANAKARSQRQHEVEAVRQRFAPTQPYTSRASTTGPGQRGDCDGGRNLATLGFRLSWNRSHTTTTDCFL